MVVIFGMIIASWAASGLVRLVPMSDVSGGCDFMDVFHEGSCLRAAVLFGDLFVRGPVDGVFGDWVPTKSSVNILHVVWKGGGFTDFMFVMASDGAAVNDELSFSGRGHWNSRPRKVIYLEGSSFVVRFAV